MRKFFKITKSVLVAGCLIGLASSTWAAVKLTETKVKGGMVYRVENYRFNLLIDPQRGGVVTSYKDKLGGNIELIHQTKYNGLCMDHFQGQNWPGEMLETPYTGKVVKNTPRECVIMLTYKVKGMWKYVEFPKLRDVQLEKTYTIKADNPALKCEVKLTAPGKASKLCPYWQQNVFFAGGKYDLDCDYTFRPTVRGVIRKAGQNFGHKGPESLIRDFSAGWSALLDVKKKSGLVILLNYDELSVLYTCAGNRTVEPMFRVKYLPAGASTTYVTYIVPVAGLDNIVAANKDFIAGYEMKSDGKGNGEITVSAVRSVNSAEKVNMTVEVVSAQPDSVAVKAGQLNFAKLGDKPQSDKVEFGKAGKDPLVFRAQVKAVSNGKATTDLFEEYFNGSYKWGENINTDMSSAFYTGKRPKQKITLYKPKKIALKNLGEHQTWYAEGLLDDYYKITQAIRLSGSYRDKTRRDRSFVNYNGLFKTQVTEFPYDYDDLLSYDLMVIGGLKKSAIGEIGDKMLTDYLRAGGAMLVLGGPSAYGPSNLKGLELTKFWPVEMSDSKFDLRKLEDGKITVTNSKVPFLEDMDWSAKPATEYVHQVKVKSWGKVILSSGGKPFLVIGEYGPKKTRVACILAPPMGTVPEGEVAFWQWKDWPYLLRQVIWWVRKDDRFRARTF